MQHGGARRAFTLLAGICLLALLLRVGHWWGQRDHNPFFCAPVMDELKHHEWAQALAAGKDLPEPFAGRPYFRAPLYYGLLGGLYALAGPNIALARFLGCVLGAVTCCLIAWLGQMVAAGSAGASPSRATRMGVIAGLLAAVYWPLIWFDSQLLTVGLEVFLNTLLLLILLYAQRRSTWWLWLAGGVVWGLAALARPNMLAYAPALAVWLWLLRRARPTPLPLRERTGEGEKLRRATLPQPLPGREGSARRSAHWLFALALCALGAALVILPVSIRNRLVGGEWVLIASSGGVNFYIGNNPQSDGVAAIVPGTRADWDGGYIDTHRIPERERGRALREGEVSDYWYANAWQWIRANPGAWLRLLWLKFRLTFSPVELYNNQPTYYFANLSPLSVVYWLGFPVITVLAGAGLALPGRDWRTWSLPLLYALTYLGTIVLYFTSDRYRLPLAPVLILLAADGLVRLVDFYRTRRWPALAAYGGIGMLVGVFLASNPPARADYFREETGQAHHHLGVHYAERADREPAIRHLLECVRLRPQDTGMRLSVAGYLTQLDRAELALQQYEQAAARDPRSAAAQAALGLALARAQRFDEATQRLKTAIELGSDSLDARLQLALILVPRGDFAGALAHFDAILAREPRHVPTLRNAAAALGRLGRFEEAAERYRRILAVDPNDAEATKALEYTQQRLAEPRSTEPRPAEPRP
jgi:tetratricopeptide (TPR) repeat protein